MTHDLFLPREINRNEQNFLRRFMMSDAVMIFFITQKYSGHLVRFFNLIIHVTFMLFAMPNPSKFKLMFLNKIFVFNLLLIENRLKPE